MEKKFRFYKKKIFLTFSQIEYEGNLEIYKEKLIKKLGHVIKYACIGYGKHKDGGDHLHVYMDFKERFSISKENFFDFVCGKQRISEIIKKDISVNYIKNHLFIEWGEVTKKKDNAVALRESLEKHQGDILAVMKEGDETMRQTLYREGSKANVYAKHVVAENYYAEGINKKEMVCFDLEILKKNDKFNEYIDEILPILEFINKSLKVRHYKSDNLLIHSNKPDLGKTALLNLLDKITPCYHWPTDLWFPMYKNKKFQYILWDEFTLRGFPEEFMKRLLAGNELQLPIKGTHVIKKDNPLILCTANLTLKSLVLKKTSSSCLCSRADDGTPLCKETKYCKVTKEAIDFYDALLARLKVISITKPVYPNGKKFPEDWEEYNNLLLSSIVFKRIENKTE